MDKVTALFSFCRTSLLLFYVLVTSYRSFLSLLVYHHYFFSSLASLFRSFACFFFRCCASSLFLYSILATLYIVYVYICAYM